MIAFLLLFFPPVALCKEDIHADASSRVQHLHFGRIGLCIFVPMTSRVPKEVALIRTALRTWASPEEQHAAGAHVRFASPTSINESDLQPHIINIPGDTDTDYRHLPIRVWK